MRTLLGAIVLAILVPAQEKTAKDLLQAAVKEAKEKNRRVLLTFGSPG